MPLPAQYFQKLVESCPDIIIAVDKLGIITFYNDGAVQNKPIRWGSTGEIDPILSHTVACEQKFV